MVTKVEPNLSSSPPWPLYGLFQPIGYQALGHETLAKTNIDLYLYTSTQLFEIFV